MSDRFPVALTIDDILMVPGHSEVTPADIETVRGAVGKVSFPTWAEICDKANPGCSAAWKATVGKAIGVQ